MAKKKTAKKPPKRLLEVSLGIRGKKQDRDAFDRAAELEGFNNRTSWSLYHLRRAAKATIELEDDE